MKKVTSIILALILALGALSVCSVSAAQNTPVSFETYEALYAHAVTGSTDSEAWQAWQSEHDEDFMEVNSNVKYFFLPTSADDAKVDIYNAYKSSVNVNGVDIASGEIKTVDYDVNTSCSVKTADKTYTLKFMKSNAEAAIYINNSNADGNGTELMQYLNITPGSVTPLCIMFDTEKKVKVLYDQNFEGKKVIIHPLRNTASISCTL